MTAVNRGSARRAFTMLEVMIVVAILGIVMGMTVIALNSASAETTMSTTEGALQNSTNQFVVRLVTELRGASRATVTVDTDGAGISFRVPVDWDDDGDVVDDDGDPEYGATLGKVHTAGVDIVYRFLPNDGDVLNEAELGVDIDGDPPGDAGRGTETFFRGRFTRAAPDDDGVTSARATSDRWFLLEKLEVGEVPEDVIFEQETDGTITIRLMAADVMERQETPVRSQVTTSVRPYNP
jgi:prepilin-type N-terminal cleavage/methylation domain-containing protein